jgi:hypothetical protein
MGLGQEPLCNARLGELLSVQLPLTPALTPASKRPFSGGFANGGGLARTAVSVPSRRVDNQRFSLARLIGWVRAAPAGEHLLPVTDARTALQKLERSFAQELLCAYQNLFDGRGRVYPELKSVRALFDYAAGVDGTPLAAIERDGDWHVGLSPEIAEAARRN